MPKIRISGSLTLPSGAFGVIDAPTVGRGGLASLAGIDPKSPIGQLAKIAPKAALVVGTAAAGLAVGHVIGKQVVKAQERRFEKEFGISGSEARDLAEKQAAWDRDEAARKAAVANLTSHPNPGNRSQAEKALKHMLIVQALSG